MGGHSCNEGALNAFECTGQHILQQASHVMYGLCHTAPCKPILHCAHPIISIGSLPFTGVPGNARSQHGCWLAAAFHWISTPKELHASVHWTVLIDAAHHTPPSAQPTACMHMPSHQPLFATCLSKDHISD